MVVTHKFWADNECGNTSDTCYQTFTWIIDNGAPTTTTCNEGNDFGCQSTTPNITPIPPTWVDACGFTAGQLAGTPTNNGCNWSVTHKFWADDECGNTSDTCYQTFTWIIDNGAPTTTTCNEGNDFGCQSTTPNITPIPPTWVDACGFTAGQLAGTPTNNGCNWSVTHKFWADDECGNTSDTCYQTFTWTLYQQIDVSCPSEEIVDACDFTSDADLENAFNDWLNGNGFTVVNPGCASVDDAGFAPYDFNLDRCTGGSITVKFGLKDGCSEDTCTATYTVTPISPITVSCPADPDLPACASQSSIMYAYLGWVNGFKVSGGCNPSSNIADIPPLPNYMCGEAVNLSFEFKAYDDCTRDSCMATFTVAAAPQLFCQAPDPKSKPACASTDDFEEWKLQFTAGGGCSPTISYNIVINGQPVSPVSNLDNLQPPSMCGDSIWIQITVSDRCFQTLSRSSYYAIAEDTTKPEILDLESGSDLGCNPQSFPAPNPDNITADDDCGIAEIIIIPPEHDVVGCDGRYSYGYQVMDNCGNMSDIHVVNYSYTVDNDPPEFMPPAQILVLECTDPVPNPVEPLVRDACGDPKVVLMSEVRNDRSDCPFVGEVVRTWMATDGCGNTSTWDEVIGIQDNTTPVFAQLPPDICEDRAMTFEEFKYMVFQPLPIEGGCEPLLSEDPVIEFDCGACRYVITYNFQNDCGYAISHTQYVCIHVMPLSCSIAGLNELVCGEEERLAAVVSGGAGGNTYSWAVASGDWTIISPVDEPTIEIRAGTGESKVILTVTDQAGCISTCEYILSCGDPEGCSFSENFYGQDGLKSCYWKDTYEQIRHVLLNGDVTIGIKGQRSFTATHGDEYCIIDFLPGSGAPAALLSGDGGFVSCKATNIQKKANGVSNNSLASEALTMALNFGLDSNFAKIRIIDECFITVDLADCMSENPPVVLGSEDTTCLPVSIFDILGEKWTISDLFNLANQELAGINTGVDLEDLTTAMHYLNVAFEECKRIIEFGQFPNPDDLTPDPKMWDNGKHGTCKVKVSPNPVAYFTTINVTLNRDRDAQISIINTNSDVVAQYKLHGKKGVNHLNLNLYNYQRGLYTVMVISEDLVLTTKMLKVY